MQARSCRRSSRRSRLRCPHFGRIRQRASDRKRVDLLRPSGRDQATISRVRSVARRRRPVHDGHPASLPAEARETSRVADVKRCVQAELNASCRIDESMRPEPDKPAAALRASHLEPIHWREAALCVPAIPVLMLLGACYDRRAGGSGLCRKVRGRPSSAWPALSGDDRLACWHDRRCVRRNRTGAARRDLPFQSRFCRRRMGCTRLLR